jgi:hypothetical protein
MTSDPPKPSFLTTLGYVLGLMAVLAIVVFIVIAITRILR